MAVISFSHPIRLKPDNFTSQSRTPWAGQDIIRRFKTQLMPWRLGERVGESWEFSCDSTFPSFLNNYPGSLIELVRDNASEILGKEWQNHQDQPHCEILVKMINAAEPLSFQVHPDDSYPKLGASECGKPESWLVLHAEPGAGLYLGFKRKISKNELRDLLTSGKRAEEVLQFVPVRPGDYFEIAPGIPHAVGSGMTLLEPQRVLQGKSGKTYRLWDWGRKYDTHGNLDPISGSSRELHVEDSLNLINPEHQVGPEFVETVRRRPRSVRLENGMSVHVFPANPSYQVAMVDFGNQINNESPFVFSIDHSYAVTTILNGEIELVTEPNTRFLAGETMLLPHRCFPQKWIASGTAHTRLALIWPAFAKLSVSPANL